MSVLYPGGCSQDEMGSQRASASKAQDLAQQAHPIVQIFKFSQNGRFNQTKETCRRKYGIRRLPSNSSKTRFYNVTRRLSGRHRRASNVQFDGPSEPPKRCRPNRDTKKQSWQQGQRGGKPQAGVSSLYKTNDQNQHLRAHSHPISLSSQDANRMEASTMAIRQPVCCHFAFR